MKNVSRLALSLTGVLLCVSQAHAAIPNTSHTTTSLGPTFQPSYTGVIDATTAFNAAAEVGWNNYRFGGTLGFQSQPNRRFKITAEYFSQDITYGFFAGNKAEWVSQFAIGGDYQYDIPVNFLQPQADLIAYYGHVANKNVGITSGSYTLAGTSLPFNDNRHLAGSNDWGVTPMLSVHPWRGAKAGLGLNYDFVHYSKIFAPKDRVTGFGGTALISQTFFTNFEVGAQAAVRQPFNDYQASVVWSNVPNSGHWAVGLDGDYTAGKHTLPSSYNVGLSMNYFFDQRTEAAATPTPPPAAAKGAPAKTAPVPVQVPVNDGLLAWTGKPAVHLPEVLSVTDEKITP